MYVGFINITCHFHYNDIFHMLYKLQICLTNPKSWTLQMKRILGFGIKSAKKLPIEVGLVTSWHAIEYVKSCLL